MPDAARNIPVVATSALHGPAVNLRSAQASADHTHHRQPHSKAGTGRLWSTPKGTTIVLVEEGTVAELEEAEYLIRNQQDLTGILDRLGHSDQPVQVFEREYVMTGMDAGTPLGEVDGLLGVAERVFVLMHKSVMTAGKVLDSRKKLLGFCEKVCESSEAPPVHLKGQQLCLVLATDCIPHGKKDNVHELCQFYGIPLLLPSQHSYQLDNHVSLNDANTCVPT
ncbi:hypothetical protein WJX72_009875 [[Myrmecia] bisecta]|uniref:Uncharacterized protein n=1 Tax=[Myrmecia] bisecta TaxID=41462 RepID=A0AAW1QG39_9CHLO